MSIFKQNNNMDVQNKLAALRVSEQLFAQVLKATSEAIIVIDKSGKIILGNDKSLKMFGYSESELAGLTIRNVAPQRFHAELERAWPLYVRNLSEVELGYDKQLFGLRKDGTEFPASLRITALHNQDEPLIIVALADKSYRKKAELDLQTMAEELRQANSSLHRLSHLDQHTGVLNRRGLEKVLSHELAIAIKAGQPIVAALIDLDNFKHLNNNVGHAMGDLAIKGVVDRISSVLRPTDYLGRVGGDSFLAMLPNTALEEGIQIVDRIRETVGASPLPIAFEDVKITVSAGVVGLPDDTCSLEEVIMLTKVSLKMSKATGRNKISIGDKRKLDDSKDAVNEIDESKILQQGYGFRTISHPIYDIRNESLRGYELLTRGPSGPLETPYDFFRISRENEILTVVDLNCLKLSIAHAQSLGTDMRFHVNLFPSTLIDIPGKQLAALFEQAKQQREFCVELSEQQFIAEPSYLQKPVKYLRSAGILIAIDDVGFGRSSLETLILLEPDIIKIDIKYVIGIAKDSGKERAVARMLKIADAIGAELVAEGVESKEDLQVLKELGIIYGQGMLWGEPV